jgi:site-specific DNA recombinase
LQDDHKSLSREIKQQEEKISYIRDLLSTKQIDPADFREMKLDYIYEHGEIDRKRTVISSMYPEKLTFDGDRLRTNRINEAARIIYALDKAFGENERGQSGNIPTLSSQVGMARFELATSWSQTRRDDRTTLHPGAL